MTSAPPSPAKQLAEADAAVVAASREWPEPETPYAKLIGMERTAERLTYIGAIPGVLLDMESVHRRDAQKDRSRAEMQHGLLVARQELVAARLAAGELQPTLLLESNYYRSTALVAPDRVKPQTQKLIAALHAGWNIQMVPTGRLGNTLPPDTYDMVLAGDPMAPSSVYREEIPKPTEGLDIPQDHEWWASEGEPLWQAAEIYTALSDVAMTPARTRVSLILGAQRG